jgi:hypothetical protein
MVMVGFENMSTPKAPAPVERIQLVSFDSYNIANQASDQMESASKERIGIGGQMEQDSLNTPRTATSDVNFSFVRSQMELSQEAPPIIGWCN